MGDFSKKKTGYPQKRKPAQCTLSSLKPKIFNQPKPVAHYYNNRSLGAAWALLGELYAADVGTMRTDLLAVAGSQAGAFEAPGASLLP